MPESKKRAMRAIDKPAAYGPDLDINRYSRSAEGEYRCPLTELPEEVVKRSLEVGVTPREDERSATYFQIDHSVIFSAVQEMFKGKVEVLSTAEALQKYGWFKDYWWRLVEVDTDKYTALTELKWDQGYFIRVLEGEKVTLPLQTCLFVSTDNLNQNVHNVVIAEPESEIQIITGCTVHRNVNRGLHVGVSEFYIKRGAKITFTMIHDWSPMFDTRPRTGALIEEDGDFICNYICLRPVKSLQTYPVAYCKGANSRARFNSIVYGSSDSYLDVGAKIVLQSEGSRGEIVSRAIGKDESTIYARGLLVGEHANTKAHLECRGLLLSDEASIYAAPELLAKAEGAELSHEAAIGKISEDEVCYLMARGFSREEAESLIVRGFMDVDILGLPEDLKKRIEKMIETTAERAL
ncbi:SufD family Fe-S cluster assembly protein [Candidatus Bathyarchaeota archaeon]|nr:SufD family Fe-S cluster assembly protein [Candidatus Bathyarchaeota archaeon]